MRRLALPGLMLVAFSAAFFKAVSWPAPAQFQAGLQPVPSGQAAPRFERRFASSRLHTQVHAASAIALRDGRIRAYWFSGSREGASDVAIHGAVYDPTTGRWGAEQVVVTREQTQQALHRYVSKLGNPVVARAADGSLQLFYVTVSLGGWAGSSITLMTSRDDGASWSAPRRLVTSPFINISTLVKGAPVLYEDGSMGVPVYHEFIAKFGELLRLDADGRVLDKQRLTSGAARTLQPVVLVKNAQEARVLMRYAGSEEPRRAVAVETSDGGRHWSAPEKTAMRNSNAALTGLVMQDGRMLTVFNDLERGRDALSLMMSSDGGVHWREVERLEDQLAAGSQVSEAQYRDRLSGLLQHSDPSIVGSLAQYVDSTVRTGCANGQCRFEFSYPYLIAAGPDDFHLVYTWNRTFIKHVHFNRAWLEQRLEGGGHAVSH